jgi:hypothetical protein
MSDVALNQVIELALKLSIAEQAKLLELVAANLAHEVSDAQVEPEERLDWTDEELAELLKPGEPKTGAEIAAMIEAGEFGTKAGSERMYPHLTDSVEWLKTLRRDIWKRRNLDWGNE